MSTLFQEQHQHNNSDFMDTSRAPHASTMHHPETAKNVHVYLNGDQYNPGRKFVINPRYVGHFDAFLNMVTMGLKPAFGAVRNIYTPSQGHRVLDMRNINAGMCMVAGGVGRFQKLQYTDITPPSKRPTRVKNNSYQVRPVYHNKMNVPARWKECIKDPVNIYVYGNGDVNGRAVKMLLIPRIMKNWGLVLDEITSKIKTGQAIRRLFTLNGEIVLDSENLENGRYYVAAGNERFKHCPYGERAQHQPVMILSPRKPQGSLPPIKGRGRTMNSRTVDQTYSQQYVRKKKMEEMKTFPHTTPGLERQPAPRRKLKPIKPSGPPPTSERDSVFHARPVKVKRSGASGKLTQVTPSTEHDDDVFRAKTAGEKAEEVPDDESTKVDLPLDQVQAKTVEDEDIKTGAKEEEDFSRKESSPTPVPVTVVRDENENSETHVIEEPVKTPSSPNRSEREHVNTPPGKDGEPTPLGGSAIESEVSTPAPQAQAKLGNDEAATRIQARYRGYRVRVDMTKKKEEENIQIPDSRADEKSDVHDEIPQNLPLHVTTSDGAAAEPLSDSPPYKRSPSPPHTGEQPKVTTDDQRVESVEAGRESSQIFSKQSGAEEDDLLEFGDKNTSEENEKIDPISASDPKVETPTHISPGSESEERKDDEVDGKRSDAEEKESESGRKSTSLSQADQNEPQGDPTDVNEPVFDLSSGQMISKPVLETPEPSEEDNEKADANRISDRDSGDGVDENEDVNPDEKNNILENGDDDGSQERKIHSTAESPGSRVSIVGENADEPTKAVQNGQAIPNGQSSTVEGTV